MLYCTISFPYVHPYVHPDVHPKCNIATTNPTRGRRGVGYVVHSVVGSVRVFGYFDVLLFLVLYNET